MALANPISDDLSHLRTGLLSDLVSVAQSLSDNPFARAPINDAAASEGRTIYALGENVTAFPVSYVDYHLQFSTPGSYRLYDRAKADVAWAVADQFTANSFWVPRTFNAPIATNNPEAEVAYIRSASNGSAAQANPSSTNFAIYGESTPYEVTQAMVDNREVVVLRIGTRERGMIIDRFVFSTDQALTDIAQRGKKGETPVEFHLGVQVEVCEGGELRPERVVGADGGAAQRPPACRATVRSGAPRRSPQYRSWRKGIGRGDL